MANHNQRQPPQDRNEKARQDFALAQQRRQFQQAMANGSTGIYDRFGNRIVPDMHVMYFAPAFGLVAKVVDVGPVLDPNAPVGVAKLTLVIDVPLSYRAGSRANDLLVVSLPQSTAMQSPGAGDDAAPPADQPTDTPPADLEDVEMPAGAPPPAAPAAPDAPNTTEE